MQPAGDMEGQDPEGMLFVVVTDDMEREYPWKGPFLREVSFSFSVFRGVDRSRN